MSIMEEVKKLSKEGYIVVYTDTIGRELLTNGMCFGVLLHSDEAIGFTKKLTVSTETIFGTLADEGLIIDGSLVINV